MNVNAFKYGNVEGRKREEKKNNKVWRRRKEGEGKNEKFLIIEEIPSFFFLPLGIVGTF